MNPALKSSQVAIRVEPDTLELVDRIAELAGKASVTGTAPPKAEIMRAALQRGLEQMLEELGGAKRPKRK